MVNPHLPKALVVQLSLPHMVQGASLTLFLLVLCTRPVLFNLHTRLQCCCCYNTPRISSNLMQSLTTDSICCGKSWIMQWQLWSCASVGSCATFPPKGLCSWLSHSKLSPLTFSLVYTSRLQMYLHDPVMMQPSHIKASGLMSLVFMLSLHTPSFCTASNIMGVCQLQRRSMSICTVIVTDH